MLGGKNLVAKQPPAFQPFAEQVAFVAVRHRLPLNSTLSAMAGCASNAATKIALMGCFTIIQSPYK